MLIACRAATAFAATEGGVSALQARHGTCTCVTTRVRDGCCPVRLGNAEPTR